MVVKVKTRYVKNNNKSKKYILRGQRNARYHDRIFSNKKRSNKKHNFIVFLENGNRYNVEIFRLH